MATYISLTHLTDQGMRTVKDTTQRAEAVKALAGKFGATIKDIYWTMGRYDIVVVLECQDEQAATAFAVSIGSMGNTRSETLRAFSSEEMKGVLARVG